MPEDDAVTDDCLACHPPREEGALVVPDALDGPVVRADLIAPVENLQLHPSGTHRGLDASAVPDVRRDPAMGVMGVRFG